MNTDSQESHVLSDVAERGTTRGLRTLGHTTLLDLIVKRLSPSSLAAIWNEHVAREAKEALRLTGPAKKRVTEAFSDSRRVLRDALRRNAALCSQVFFSETGAHFTSESDTSDPMIERVSPAPRPPAVRASRPLSPLEQRMFLAAAGKTGVQPSPSVASELDPEMALQLAQAADEAQRSIQTQQNFIQWVCTQADTLLVEHVQREGEALWREPIRVLCFPEDRRLRAIFVLSSTAPLLRGEASSPVVKHDFRANGLPVTHAHPEAFRQADGLKVIRSKVVRKGHHEYYVKALNYQNGMFFKGYFVVDGTEDGSAVPPRFYQVREERVTSLSEAAYHTVTARQAAGKPLVEADRPSVRKAVP